jgi:hypothetical protein
MTTPSTPSSYPLRLEGHLDEPLSRWTWLVKWLLAIPHFIVLAGLFVAFAFSWLGGLVAIAATGRLPRPVFDFNVGVLRWSWRVSFYVYGALGTDRYPPFTLADVPDYPARLDVDYPATLSRGLVLVKWWLLALPQYLVAAVLASVIGLLTFAAGVVLSVTGRYPQELFSLVMGLNRWTHRVAAYAALLTDEYPPFRLDLDDTAPAATLSARA